MAQDDKKKCPVCERVAEIRPFVHRDGNEIRCERCGHFGISRNLEVNLSTSRLEPAVKNLLPYLTAYIRQANARGEEVILGTHNWEGFARAHRETPFTRKRDKLLELLASRSKAGEQVKIDPQYDPPLVDAMSPAELNLLLEHLNELGYVRETKQTWVCILRPKAWEHLESAAASGGIQGKCFVAMSFHQSLKDAYEQGIYTAIKEDCKLEPIRVDLVHHNEKICDKIVAEIKHCQFMVADFTLQRAGVYFEAGFAMGLGRPVIWMCREDDIKNLHFDTRQYNHIIWQTPQDLREKLGDRIRATILK